jgi:hypothetical protein
MLDRHGKWAPPKNTRGWYLHDFLIGWRHRLYAHTDATMARDIFDAGTHVGIGEHIYTEAWLPMDRDQLPEIEALCQAQEQRFKAEAERMQEALRESIRVSET